MFRRLPDTADAIEFDFEGATFEARAGDSVAAALLANGVLVFRITLVSGAPRGPWCLIGNCHECLVEIDDEPNRQASMVEVRPGILVRGAWGDERGMSPTGYEAPGQPRAAPGRSDFGIRGTKS